MTSTQRIQQLNAILQMPDLLRIIDIGANPMNSVAPYKVLLDSGLCQLTGFEPQADTLDTLNQHKGPQETYIPAAIGDGRAYDLNLYHGTGLVSVFDIRRQTVAHLRGLRKAARHKGTHRIETSRLDDLVELGRIDYLKIDIQGAELMVFQNALSALRPVLAIQTEVNFYPLYDNQPSFGDIDVFLRQQGFLPHSYIHIEKRIIQSRFSGSLTKDAATQMLDGDILYLRDLSQAAEWDSDTLKRMALIAEGIYGYADVTMLCLDKLLQQGAVDEKDVAAYINGYSA